MSRYPQAALSAALLFTLLASTAAPAQPTTTLEEISVAGAGGNGGTAGVAAAQLDPSVRSSSLTVPTTAQARAEIQRTPGGVALVPDTAYKNRPAQTDLTGWLWTGLIERISEDQRSRTCGEDRSRARSRSC